MRYLADVVSLKLDPAACVGCGMCVEVCPHRLFALHGDRASIVDRDGCIECGACARNCPSHAIAVDAGTGCSVAIIHGMLYGEETCFCACEDDPDCC